VMGGWSVFDHRAAHRQRVTTVSTLGFWALLYLFQKNPNSQRSFV
jgi:hypothetical protein